MGRGSVHRAFPEFLSPRGPRRSPPFPRPNPANCRAEVGLRRSSASARSAVCRRVTGGVNPKTRGDGGARQGWIRQIRAPEPGRVTWNP